MDASALNESVTVPGWALLLVGGVIAFVGTRVGNAVLDVVLVKSAGKDTTKDAGENSAGVPSVSTCATTCRAQWELAIAKANDATKDTLGARIDAGFQGLHQRIDELMLVK